MAGKSGPSEVAVTPGPDNDASLPRLARGLTREWGRSHGHLSTGSDLVVVLRSYLGEFGMGLAEAAQAPILVDLDDDDEDFFRQSGDQAEADRYADLLVRLKDGGAMLASADGFARTVRIPNTVPFPVDPDRTHAEPGRAVVVGNFTYAPNIEGAKWMVNEVVPRVQRMVPGFDVRLVGPGSDKVAASGVGFVDDLVGEYSRAALSIAPILSGSGTRTKIIEAWAHGVPVVSTSLGAHGLGGVDGTHLLIADSAEDMATAVARILTEPETSAQLGTNGHRLAVEKFHPDVVAEQVRSLVTSAGTSRRRLLEAGENLDLSETDDGLVVFDRAAEIAHHLNTTAAVIFMMADGSMDVGEIVAEVTEVFGLDEDSVAVIEDAVDDLVRAGIARFRFAD